MQENLRTCGILLHPTSLPGPYGIGTLGANARGFVDFLHNAGQSIWQILPLGPTGYGDSPYASSSTFAGNPLLIDLDSLAAEGVVEQSELQAAPRSSAKVNFGEVIAFKVPLLHTAAVRFLEEASPERREQFDRFCQEEGWWLNDYVLFRAVRAARHEQPLNEWDEDIRKRTPAAMATAQVELADELMNLKVQQFWFFEQWMAVKKYANDRGVRIMGDMPIFVAYDSDAVWAHPEMFKVDDDLVPSVVAGVPPDYFSKTGQLWGNPLYDWERHEQDGFSWWLSRLRMALRMADIVRLDHFRGFAAAWEVPAGAEDAIGGQWVKGPGGALFDAIREEFGGTPLVAEDLGLITEDVHELRDRYGIPGMHVLHFGFDPHGDRVYAPHRARKNSVIYTGTHDNDTTVGWFRGLPHEEKELVRAYLNTAGSTIHWALLRAAYGSHADTAIIPMQDILGQGAEARMNMPGQTGSWWSYRLEDLPAQAITEHLAFIAKLYERGRSNDAT